MVQLRPRDLRACYEKLHLAAPPSLGGYLENLRRRKEILKNSSGYRLEGRVREVFNERYGARTITVQVTKLLVDLPARISDLRDRTYLDEALICYKNGAFRAAVVMTWNLAYHHLCDLILRRRLTEFNQHWRNTHPGHHKKGLRTIAEMEDLAEGLKESEVISICRAGSIITKDIYAILTEKLRRRNAAAHPSDVTISQLEAEEFIHNIVENVVLKLA